MKELKKSVGYVFVFLSVLSNAAKGFCSKKISNGVGSAAAAIDMNILRVLICCLISAGIAAKGILQNGFSASIAEVSVIALSGISMALFLVVWTFAIKSGAYMYVSASASASFIVPSLAGLIVFHERFTLFKLIAFSTVFAALYFMFRYNLRLNGKPKRKDIVLPTIVLLAQGVNQTMQKLYAVSFPQKSASEYALYSFVSTAFFLIAARLTVGFFPSAERKQDKSMRSAFWKNNLIFVVIMALCLYSASFFQTLAAKNLDAIVLYPLTNALSLVFGSFMASVFFGEKIKKECLCGMLFVFIALVLSNL